MHSRPTAPTARGASDQQLLAACRAGDAAAWERLVHDYERLVHAIPLSYGLRREEAADIAQNVFITLLQSLDKIRDDEQLRYWLSTVARRQTWRSLDRSRREVVTGFLPDAVADDPTNRWDRLEWLHDGLLALDEPCRELLFLLYLQGEPASYSEVSRRLGRPVGSIGPTRGRCLERLRRILER
jgi:RNA polymerase sigma factor (sigma-70 family)